MGNRFNIPVDLGPRPTADIPAPATSRRMCRFVNKPLGSRALAGPEVVNLRTRTIEVLDAPDGIGSRWNATLEGETYAIGDATAVEALRNVTEVVITSDKPTGTAAS